MSFVSSSNLTSFFFFKNTRLLFFVEISSIYIFSSTFWRLIPDARSITWPSFEKLLAIWPPCTDLAMGNSFSGRQFNSFIHFFSCSHINTYIHSLTKAYGEKTQSKKKKLKACVCVPLICTQIFCQ